MSLTDSQQDRMSAMSHGRPFMRAHLAGTKNEAWRASAVMAYAGNALSAVVAGIVLFRRRMEGA